MMIFDNFISAIVGSLIRKNITMKKKNKGFGLIIRVLDSISTKNLDEN